MAFNDQWPPVALSSAAKGSPKTNGNKRSLKESQQEILARLNEVFYPTLEPAVILSVVQNCNWDVESSTEGLLTLSATVEDPLIPKDCSEYCESVAPVRDDKKVEKPTLADILKEKCPQNSGRSSSRSESNDSMSDEPAKTARPKRASGKNRMGSFCGNIAKLKSSGPTPTPIIAENQTYSTGDPFFDGLTAYGSTPIDKPFICTPQKIVSHDYSPDDPMELERKCQFPGDICSDNRSEESSMKNCPTKEDKIVSPDGKKSNVRKKESESLCGLKVQYRLGGMESSEDEDVDVDADVVIEDESSDYEINSIISTSVCQFLSSSTETPPRSARPTIPMIHSPSPPRTPQRTIHDLTLSRVKKAIEAGHKILIIIRGLPGSGKTTLAKSLIALHVGMDLPSTRHIFSADDYFVDLGRGIYQWDASKLQEAHATTQRRVGKAAIEGLSPIIVDNTNIELWEMRPYAAKAVENGYIVEILEPNTPWAKNPKELAIKNSHNVPKAKIQDKLLQFGPPISGKRLLDSYSMTYSATKKPPQMRLVPPVVAEKNRKKPDFHVENENSSWGNSENKNFVLTSDDIEWMRKNIEQSGYSIDNSGVSSLDNNSERNANQVFTDFLQELQNSSHENFDSQEGSSSSDSKSSEKSFEKTSESQFGQETSEQLKDPSEDCSNNKIPSPNSWQLSAIGSERKNSIVASVDDRDRKCLETQNDNILSQCWDFTLLLGSLKLHSRHESHETVDSTELEPTTDKNDNDIEASLENVVAGHENENNDAESEQEFSKGSYVNFPDEKTKLDRKTKGEEPENDGNDDVRSENLSSSNSENSSISDMEVSDKSGNSLESDESFTGKIFDSIAGISCSKSDKKEKLDSNFPDKKAAENFDVKGSKNDESIYDIDPEIERITYVPTNPFTEEIIKQQAEKTITDNINSVSWKETPFPVDTEQLPTPSCSHQETKNISKSDSSTNTTIYDFNVAYVGGTCEPGYREIWGKNRSINESGAKKTEIESPPLKFMLDKSSMTNEPNILANVTDDDKPKESSNRLEDLYEMFPRCPQKFIKNLYEEQCKGNFDWVVDILLLADISNSTVENYEEKTKKNDKVDESEYVDAVKLWKMEKEKMKQRSLDSSPKNRVRSRAKDFRSFSLECMDYPNYSKSTSKKSINDVELASSPKDSEEDRIIDAFYENALQREFSPEIALSSASSEPPSEINDSEQEESVELNFGWDFIRQLEETVGNSDFSLPDDFKPVIKMKKSMAEELHGLWIRSLDQQLNHLHSQLDERMANDEALARAVNLEENGQPEETPVVPNLEEIMNMEMALARYRNQLEGTIARETPNDMASRLTRQMLYDLLPDIDQQTLDNILRAHDGNFAETCEIIEANIGRTISKVDTLKKQQSLVDRLNEERNNRALQRQNESRLPLIVVKPDTNSSQRSELSSKSAMEMGREARIEAQKHFSLRIETFNKASEAYRRGHPVVAAYYSQMAKLHSENKEAANARAADYFLSAQMYSVDENDTLDLHNLHVTESLEAVDLFLDYQAQKLSKSSKKSIEFTIITGRGARSKNGLSRIKPAITKKLNSRNISFTEINQGCLKVILSKRNGISDE